MGYRNECGVITIFPMSLECVSISPSSTEANDGMVSVSITGGTPPYKYTWSGDNIGNNNHAPEVEFVPIGDYTVTVVDYWGDFTATTTCTLTAATDCTFSGTVVQFTPPTPTPTKTPTPTPTSVPSKCDCRYGNVYISQYDIENSDDGTVYVNYQDCNGVCYCLTVDENNAKPYVEGIYLDDICIDVTPQNTNDVSLFIIVDGEPEILPPNGDSYVTLGGCCTTPSPSQTPTPTVTPTPTTNPCPNCVVQDITIGTQTWTKCNLDVTTYRDGTPIPQVTDPAVWSGLTTGAWCYYNNDPSNNAIYGKLYNWYAVSDPRGLAPIGYHVPTDAEWTTLTTYLGGTPVAGEKMKETGLCHWASPNFYATNTSNFTGLPGSNRGFNGTFNPIGITGNWWSSSEVTSFAAESLTLNYSVSTAIRGGAFKYYGFSVRLIKD
jgi:uncharacterized protein (TIGR02145 family)